MLVQLPVDEIPLLVASSPLAGFKPGSVCPGPRESGEPSINVMIVALRFFPALCKNQPMTSLPPTLALVSASHWPQNSSRNRAVSSSRLHLTVISQRYWEFNKNNSRWIFHPNYRVECGADWGGLGGLVGWWGMARGSWGVNRRGGSRGGCTGWTLSYGHKLTANGPNSHSSMICEGWRVTPQFSVPALNPRTLQHNHLFSQPSVTSYIH